MEAAKLGFFSVLWTRPHILIRSHVQCTLKTITVIAGRRTFLSASFSCEDAWKNRLSEPVVKAINHATYYAELDRKLKLDKRISAIDFDLFVNSITAASHLEEVEDLVHRFRRTPDTIYTRPSTPHAVIRTFLQFGQFDTLLRMLNDRLNYGLFPDEYCYSLMMDTFLKLKNNRDAARVATLMMLQEDFGQPLSTHLALYSCLSYLRDPLPEPWKADPPPPPEEETEEQVIIRLNYLPSSYFDDHFDLKDPGKLVGKTVAMIGKEFDGEIGNTCQLIGYAMHGKWDTLRQLLTGLLESGKQSPVNKEGVSRLQECLESIPDDDAKTREETTKQITPLIERLQPQIVDGDMLESVRLRLTDAIGRHEKEAMDRQLNLYHQWTADRQGEVEKQVQTYIRNARIKKLEEMKEDLQKREKLLYFFENFEKHAMRAEAYDKVAAEVAAEKAKQPDDSTYIPPDVRKPRVTKK